MYRLTVKILSRLLYPNALDGTSKPTKSTTKQAKPTKQATAEGPSFLELFNNDLGAGFFQEFFFTGSYQLCRWGEMVLCLDALAKVSITYPQHTL